MAYFMNVELDRNDFDTIEDYNRALVEQNRIEKINKNVDITDPFVAKTLLDGFAGHPEMFRTIVGQEFLEVLHENAKELMQQVEQTSNQNMNNQNSNNQANSNKTDSDQSNSEAMESQNQSDTAEGRNDETDANIASRETSAALEAAEGKIDNTTQDKTIISNVSQKAKQPISQQDIKKSKKNKKVWKLPELSMKHFRIFLLLYILIGISFPILGFAYSIVVLMVAFIDTWVFYYEQGLETQKLVLSVVCIVIFPVGLVLSLIGCMKKVKYIVMNYKIIVYSFLFYLMPVLLFLNLTLINHNAGYCIYPFLVSLFVEAGLLGRTVFICNTIFIIGVILYFMLSYMEHVIDQMDEYTNQKKITENIVSIFFDLPVVVLCMFVSLLHVKVLKEEELG